MYGTQVRSSHVCNTGWTNLQAQQNNALRTITGSTKMSKIEHLHNEGKLLQVKEHSELLTKQHLAQMHYPDHPNHHITQKPNPPPRIMRQTPMLSHKNAIPELTLDPLPPKKVLLNTLHTDAVEKSRANQPPNQVLKAQAPEISKDEATLPRRTRTTLSQIRSDYSPYLKSYLFRINRAPDDLCPKCNISPHTANHLFECPANPTPLTAEDLWINPLKVAEFLDLPTTEMDDSVTEEPVDPG